MTLAHERPRTTIRIGDVELDETQVRYCLQQVIWKETWEISTKAAIREAAEVVLGWLKEVCDDSEYAEHLVRECPRKGYL